MITHSAILKILDLPDNVEANPRDMAKDITLTTYPYEKDEVNDEVLRFYNELKQEMEGLGVSFISFDKALYDVSVLKRIGRVVKLFVNDILYIWNAVFSTKDTDSRVWMGTNALANAVRRKRIEPGVSVIALSEEPTGNLPMDYVASFRNTSVITILPMPDDISSDSSFEDHFTTALNLFAHHMTNIIIGVDKEDWLLYNFNASHPTFPRSKNFRKNLLQALIPKIYAPIHPPQLDNFVIEEEAFDAQDQKHKPLVHDMVHGGSVFGDTNLYPDGRRLRELSFRNDFYEWIGKLHIDKRNGMSFGFLARQMPADTTDVEKITSEEEKALIQKKGGYIETEEGLYILLDFSTDALMVAVPEVWVLTQRSGSDKTDMDPVHDLVKLGLKNGQMHLRTPAGVEIEEDYRPSFDTKVILAHAVGNAIAASVFNYFQTQKKFVERIINDGVAIAHWHGYVHAEHVPDNMQIHGVNRPHVACSSPQSALFALEGKLECIDRLLADEKEFIGDIHVEPHHGINVIYPSLEDLGKKMKNNPSFSKLGNEYLQSL